MSETYTIGGDTLQSVDNPNWQGQTFRVLEPHILQFIDLEMRGAMTINQPVIQVFLADANHEPYGYCLSRNRYIVERKSGTFTTGRVRFSMQPYLLTLSSYYVIIVGNFPPIGGNLASWQYDKDDATYPRGIRISTNDGGVTWTKHHNDDFMFAEFGDPPLPKPEPPPPIEPFAPIAITYFHNPATITITLATSVPCHLTCYYTDKTPLKHHTTRVVRGLTVPWSTYFCFVGWKAVEQSEPGDTLYHTFEIPDWQLCQTKWFTFRGTVDEVLSPSVGPIFKHHHSGTELFCNLSFENYPITPSVPPCWKADSLGTGEAIYSRDEINVQHGLYSCKIEAIGMDFIAKLKQTKYMTPYLGKTVKFTFNWFGSGRGGITCPGMIYRFNTGPGWHTKSKTFTFGLFDSLRTFIINSGGRGSAYTSLSWDNITIEIL